MLTSNARACSQARFAMLLSCWNPPLRRRLSRVEKNAEKRKVREIEEKKAGRDGGVRQTRCVATWKKIRLLISREIVRKHQAICRSFDRIRWTGKLCTSPTNPCCNPTMCESRIFVGPALQITREISMLIHFNQF